MGMPGAGYSRRTEDAPVHSPSREASLQDAGAEAIRAIKAPFLSASATVFVEEAALHYKRREKSPPANKSISLASTGLRSPAASCGVFEEATFGCATSWFVKLAQ